RPRGVRRRDVRLPRGRRAQLAGPPPGSRRGGDPRRRRAPRLRVLPPRRQVRVAGTQPAPLRPHLLRATAAVAPVAGPGGLRGGRHRRGRPPGLAGGQAAGLAVVVGAPVVAAGPAGGGPGRPPRPRPHAGAVPAAPPRPRHAPPPSGRARGQRRAAGLLVGRPPPALTPPDGPRPHRADPG